MTDDMEALARRAVACAGWRWMGGMRGFRACGGPLRKCDTGDWWVRSNGNDTDEMGEWPDLTDPATLGALLALVREAHDDETLYAAKERPAYAKPWRVWSRVRGPIGYGETEAEALVDALEAAP